MLTYGRFRVRRDKRGALEVWSRGWRLESRVVPLAPLAMAAALLVSPIGLPMKVIGVVMLVGCAWVARRLCHLGFTIDEEGVGVVGVLRTVKLPWDDVAGFVGERNPHEGRAVLVGNSGERVAAPGTFAAEEMDPFGDEGEEGIVDELNRLVWSVRRGDPLPV